MDSLQPVRKISAVSPITHTTHPTSTYDVFFASPGPSGVSVTNNFLELIGTENNKICDDIKSWWANMVDNQ
uniref:Uncharacterized protein n=1 Tax=Panagrellus redivivus TaxID=6233 RepID=A0A7E4ZSD4_PANRE